MKTQFTVDKEFIKEAYNSACPDWKDKLKNKFPEAFGSELLPNVWNYVVGSNGYLIFGNKKDNGGNYIGYGFDLDDNDYFEAPYRWIRDCQIKSTRPATDKEVETALIAEAKRRGYSSNMSIKDNEIIRTIGKCGSYYYNPNINMLHYKGVTLFDNGKWAEICEELIEVTLEEIAEKFNVNVEQLKIKK